MGLRSRNKRLAEFQLASLTDIVFLLLIFFVLTSSIVSPNALNILLPNSDSQTQATQSVSISIDKDLKYYLNGEEIDPAWLETMLPAKLAGQTDPTVVLSADKSVPVEYVVGVMNIASSMKIKMVLATTPKK
ncbi:MAG: biopolymer transporter ExbD [Chitinophagales bacterium]|jgi:biopolymer transport protein ExbD|nr:biopolymer transporter ExbD [Bacteroidota bacterium]MBK9554877.1 biopolymer transporter ExbD [Bacteroidota bacterium]MBL0281520.1 biopolymer transporter ExbD [Bacteroidota bacterium]MBP9878620.1 biopolymer transporter ExbD [Chitinophagales bacterium]